MRRRRRIRGENRKGKKGKGKERMGWGGDKRRGEGK